MWNKAGMKYCWHCLAILPFKVTNDKSYCLKCGKEIKPIEAQNDETTEE